jgi:hypothetical protein
LTLIQCAEVAGAIGALAMLADEPFQAHAAGKARGTMRIDPYRYVENLSMVWCGNVADRKLRACLSVCPGTS